MTPLCFYLKKKLDHFLYLSAQKQTSIIILQQFFAFMVSYDHVHFLKVVKYY